MNRFSRNRFYGGPKKDLLKSIWQENGRLPNMARMERRGRHRFFRFLAILTIFSALLAGFTWLGIFFTSGRNQNEGVKITISAPTEADNLKETEIKINLKNTDSQPMAMTSLFLRYHQDLSILSAEPAADNENNNQWTLGTLEAKQEKTITLKTKIAGNAGDKINLQAILNYKPANFNSEFQVISSTEISLKEPLFDLTFNEPGEALPGESFGLEISLRNNSEEPLANAVLELIAPDSFLIDKTEPTMENNQRLAIKELAAGQEKKIKIRGGFASEAEGSYDFTANLLAVDGDKNYLLKTAKQTVPVTKSNLILRLFVNEQAENQQAKLGDTLQIRLDLDNQSANEFEDLNLTLYADSPLLDLKNFDSDYKGKINNDGISWNSSSWPALLKIKANDKLSLNFKINLLASANSQIEPTIKFSAEALVGKINSQPAETVVKTGSIFVKVGSDLGLESSARYYDNNHKALGSGPLPPEVNKETKYVIFWRLENNYHELQDLKVTADLPANIRFDGKKSLDAGNFSFDPEKRTVSWDISRLPNTVNKVEAQFNIAALPQAEDRGKILLLLSEAQVVATDTALNSQIAARASAINSNLDDDKYAAGKGVVK